MDVNESEDLIQRLLDLISQLTAIGSGVKSYYKKECSNFTRRIKVLAPLFEELMETGSSLPAGAVTPFRVILSALSEAKDVLQDCRDGSQLAMVKGRAEINSRFWKLTSAMSQALDGLPLDSLDISDEVREQVEFVQSQLTKAKGRMSAKDVNMFSAVNALLVRETDDSGDHAMFQILTERLHLEMEMSLKREVRAPENCSNVVASRSERDDLDRLMKILKKIHPTLQDASGAKGPRHSRAAEQGSTTAIETDNNLADGSTANASTSQHPISSLKRVESVSAPAPPNDFKCPISLEVMTDPVIVATGQTYERACIRQWLDTGHKTCPKTGQVLPHLVLTPNYVLRSLIASWCENNGLMVPKVDEELLAKQQQILSILAKLASDDDEVRCAAAGELRRQAKISLENRLCIAESGAIPFLVSLLSAEGLKTQEHAVTALLNLSIQESNKKAIVSAGAIDPIVNVLKHGSMEARENSAAALFSLSNNIDAYKVAIGKSGAIPALVQLLKDGEIRGKKDAATALFQLSIYTGNKLKVVRTGIVQPLMELLMDPTSGMVDEALAILSVLVTHHEGRSAIGKAAHIIPILVDLIRTGSPRNTEKAASVLLALCVSNNSHAATARQLGAAPSIEKLLQSGTARAKRKAVELLQYMNEQDPMSTSADRTR